MLLVLTGFGVICLLEALLYLKPVWELRKPFVIVIGLFLGVVSIGLAVVHFAFWTILIAVLSTYRLVNLYRAYRGRLQQHYLWFASRRTSFRLISLQIVILFVVAMCGLFVIPSSTYWHLLLLVQTIIVFCLFVNTLVNIRSLKHSPRVKSITTKNLPSLTVAIPARNETLELEECLKSLLLSDYPKLEILVLDDCSQNKRTPEIIRSFAHDGVHFIAGSQPPEHWLAKNYAYSRLAEHANGELILFCGVDVRFEPQSLRNVVSELLGSGDNMMSIIPLNRTGSGSLFGKLLLQPVRYAWELTPTGWLKPKVPVLSTCWIASKSLIKSAGGFASSKQTILPEKYFANYAVNNGLGYRFTQHSPSSAVTNLKSTHDQKSTAVRTRYPLLHKKIEYVAVVSILEVCVLLLPYIVFIYSLVTLNVTGFVLSGITTAMVAISYAKLVRLTYGRYGFLGFIVTPISCVLDLFILNYSMWKYEFDEVIWKDRNVCIPVMQIEPKLPPF